MNLKISEKIKAAYAAGKYVNSKRFSPEIKAQAAERTRATKLAKRISKTCAECGKVWLEKPSHDHRVYCSRACLFKAKTQRKPYPCPDCGVEQVRLPSRFGERCVACGRKAVSESHKGKGHAPQMYETEESKERQLAHTQTDEFKSKVSALFKDKHPQSPKLKQFSPHHVRAVECFLRDPRGRMWYVRNICRFVHEHLDLFDPEDTEQRVHGGKPSKSYVCNAAQGLSRIRRGVNGTWKGWMLVSNREGRETFDLLGRNYEYEPQEPPTPPHTESPEGFPKR